MEPFQENVRSFCTRIRTDARQIEYLSDRMLFSEALQQVSDLKEIRVYLKKISDHLDEAEKLIKGEKNG